VARWIAFFAVFVVAACLLPGVVTVWIDEDGHTYLTNREEAPAPGAVELGPDELVLEWHGNVAGPVLTDAEASTPEDRFVRELRVAAEDLQRGETRLGLERLRRLQREHPARPEPSWLIAQAERRRGRLSSARQALEQMLTVANDIPDRWRESGSRLLEEIDAELKLERYDPSQGYAVQALDTDHFRIRYDHAFAGRDYGARVKALLEEARLRVQESIGRVLDEPLDVNLYTRGRYLETHKHKFGFATVGFFDGAIHVVSARQPRRELLALLVHEYAHAVFRDALKSDQPFLINEGIADREEERVRGREQLAREEWRRLLDALRADEWIPLRSLVRGFGGLEGKRALLAYLEARAAIELIETARPGAMGRWLARCARGQRWERALVLETGWTLQRLEDALQAEVRGRFPESPLASWGPLTHPK
jgi:tetratricopeptide (TPR) repeat protein